MSGKTRVGLSSTAFSPGEWYISVSVGLTSARVPNWRNSGPLVLVLSTRPVPPVPPLTPMSFCSHM